MFDEFEESPRRGQTADSAAENAATARDRTEATGMQNASSRTRYRSSYGDAAMSWLALGALLAAWHMESRLDRPIVTGSRLATVRETSRYANELWLSGVTRARSWITRAANAGAAMTTSAMLPATQFVAEQPDWSAIASVRTAKRWLGSREK